MHKASSLIKLIVLLFSASVAQGARKVNPGMKIVRKDIKDTEFIVQVVITYFSSLIIAVMIGKVADATTCCEFFAIEVAIGLLIFILIPITFKNYFYNKYENS